MRVAERPAWQIAYLTLLLCICLVAALFMAAAGREMLPAPRPRPTRHLTPTRTPPATLAPLVARLAVSPTPAPSLTPSQPPPSPTIRPTSSPRPLPSATKYVFPSFTPRLYSRQIIGYSHEQRPLEVRQFGKGPTARMLVAGIHGGSEWNTVALADELIAYLKQNPAAVPPDRTLYILRNLNPDGYARARGVEGHNNAHGVDLNRNWNALWQADWPRDGCWAYPVSAGPHPNSEPETQALAAFLQKQKIDALINYHSAALGIFPGGQPPDPASLSLAQTLAAVSSYPYPPIDTGCKYTGQMVDWASLHGIAAVDLELSNHRDTDFAINLGLLQALLAWNRP